MFFLSVHLLKLLTGTQAQLCSQILLLPFGKTMGQIKFPFQILIKNSGQGSSHIRLHNHARSHTHRNTHSAKQSQEILPGGGSMPSMSLALRLGQPILCCPLAPTNTHTQTHTLASHQLYFTLTMMHGMSFSMLRWKYIYGGGINGQRKKNLQYIGENVNEANG